MHDYLALVESTPHYTQDLFATPQRLIAHLNKGDYVCRLTVDAKNNNVYQFECIIPDVQPHEFFGLTFTLEYLDADHQLQSTTGFLRGEWDAQYDYDLHPIAPELANSLTTHPALADLLHDHVLLIPYYQAELPKTAHALSGKRVGVVRLLGQTTFNQQPVRYTVNTPFQVDDGIVTYFALNRAIINHLLDHALQSLFTSLALTEKPMTVIDLWYSTGTLLREALKATHPPTTVRLLYDSKYAEPDQPFQAFSFDTTVLEKGMYNLFIVKNDQIVLDKVFVTNQPFNG